MPAKSSDLLLRVLSAGVLAPSVIAAVLLGGWWLLGFVLLLVTLAIVEYVALVQKLAYQPQLLFALGLGWAILAHAFFTDLALLWPAVAAVLIGSLFWHVIRDRSRTVIENWLLPLAGTLYISWMASHMLLFRSLPQGELRLLSVIGITVLADVGAYFVGRAWGKRKLAPHLSPKKTWEGLAGGIAWAVIGGPILTGLIGLEWWHGLVLGLLVSISAPMGDLGISMIKRQVGVKDTGNIIPGHGGALDRLDSALVTVVIGYYFNLLVSGAVLPW